VASMHFLKVHLAACKYTIKELTHFRIIVPPDLGYPDNDYNKLGPKPTTFSVKHLPDFRSYPCQVCSNHVQHLTFVLQGQRALDFVLRNQGLIDKTLLFDIELLKIIPNQ